MSSWKLMAAAIKAQRTWANLTPEQKEQVRQKAQAAASNAYARFKEEPQAGVTNQTAAPQAAPSAEPSAAAQPDLPAGAAAPETAAEAPAEPPKPPETSVQGAAALAAVARAHGPRLARQAVNLAASRSRSKAGQLYSMWRRAQGP